MILPEVEVSEGVAEHAEQGWAHAVVIQPATDEQEVALEVREQPERDERLVVHLGERLVKERVIDVDRDVAYERVGPHQVEDNGAVRLPVPRTERYEGLDGQPADGVPDEAADPRRIVRRHIAWIIRDLLPGASADGTDVERSLHEVRG